MLCAIRPRSPRLPPLTRALASTLKLRGRARETHPLPLNLLILCLSVSLVLWDSGERLRDYL